MNSELKIRIKITFKDFLNFQFWISRRRLIRPLIYVAFLLLLLPSIISIALSGTLNSFLFTPATIAPLSILLVFPIILTLTIYFSSKRIYENDPIIKKEQEFVFNAEGFTYSTENSTTILKWEEIYKQAESPKNLLIYCSPNKTFIIPKHCLSEIEIADLKIFLTNVVSKEKKYFLRFQRILPLVIILISVGVGVLTGLSDSKNTSGYFNEGNIKMQKRDFAGAIVDFDKVIKDNPSDSQTYASRGYAKAMLHDYTGAINDCNKAVELDQKNDDAYYFRAYAKCVSGDSIGGCNDYNKAADLGNKAAKKDMVYYCK
ncbi:MAG: YcxB family protein [Bacteroidia bacterium]